MTLATTRGEIATLTEECTRLLRDIDALQRQLQAHEAFIAGMREERVGLLLQIGTDAVKCGLDPERREHDHSEPEQRSGDYHHHE